MNKLLLTLDEAAERLSLGRTTLRRLINDGEIGTIRVGSAIRIPIAEIQRWIDDRTFSTRQER